MKEQLTSPESKKERLIVEIGCGAAPFLRYARPEFKEYFKTNSNVLYFGLDIEERDVEFAEEIVRYNLEHELGEEVGSRFAFVEADGSQLPIMDKSVDELILSNVLGDPRIDRKQGESPGETKKKILQEAYRVLKSGGRLTIHEDITPQVTRRNYWIEEAEEIFDTKAKYNELADSEPVELRWPPHYVGSRDRISSFVARIQKKI
jgi:ubiquinone/menaquinone biosynthesis C-methylase UbiE